MNKITKTEPKRIITFVESQLPVRQVQYDIIPLVRVGLGVLLFLLLLIAYAGPAMMNLAMYAIPSGISIVIGYYSRQYIGDLAAALLALVILMAISIGFGASLQYNLQIIGWSLERLSTPLAFGTAILFAMTFWRRR